MFYKKNLKRKSHIMPKFKVNKKIV